MVLRQDFAIASQTDSDAVNQMGAQAGGRDKRRGELLISNY
jgi:hypothetical protein